MKAKSLAEMHPELLEEWDYVKNGNLKPTDVSYGSGKKVWWICKKRHSYQSYIYSRSAGTGCPYCAGKVVAVGENDLASLFPQLAQEWNYDKNHSLMPQTFSAYSNKKVWWKGQCGHEWEAIIYSRTKGTGCPFCSGKMVLPGFNDLATQKPELAREWLYEKNGDFTPHNITAGSGKKVWWMCEHNHQWQATIVSRVHGNGCPVCSGLAVQEGIDDLQTTNPQLASEWHPTKNKSLTPRDVKSGSTKKVWWLGKCGHEWQAEISNRSKGDNCPYCSNHKILKGFNDLATTHKHLMEEWDFSKNTILPDSISAGSKVKVWWIGKCKHSYQTSVFCRTQENPTGCPICSGKQILYGFNDLETLKPQIAKEWDYERNKKLTPKDIGKGSTRKIFWLCPFGHSYQATVGNRVMGRNCPICNLRNKTSFPEQAILYYVKKHYQDAISGYKAIFTHSMELDIFIPSIKVGIEYDGEQWHKSEEHQQREIKKYNICKEHDIFLIRIKESRIQNTIANCDAIIYIEKINDSKSLDLAINELKKYLKITGSIDVLRDKQEILTYLTDLSNGSLANTNPDIVSEWDYKRNGDLKPEMFYPYANQKIWWLCSKGHSWKTTINHRVNGTGCPFCTGRKVLSGENDLLSTHPTLSEEWHPSRNGTVTPDQIGSGSGKKVWWLGKCGHEWQAPVRDRAQKQYGCPYCSGHRVLAGDNDLQTLYSKLAKEWHPYKNQGLKPSQVTVRNNRKVWWLCEQGHEWQATIRTRTILNYNCPYCSGRRKKNKE